MTHAPMQAMLQPQSLAATPLFVTREEVTLRATGAACFGRFMASLLC
jgi:hypothetical protein